LIPRPGLKELLERELKIIPVMREDDVERGLSSSPIKRGGSEDLGGIDLNPNSIRMDRQGEAIDINLPAAQIDRLLYMNIEGFVPVIINVTPITNVLLLLGLTEMPEDEPTTLGADLPDATEPRRDFI